MTDETLTADRVAVLLQYALLGEVSSALRRVGFSLSGRRIALSFFYDGPISPDDLESAEVVETELLAALSQSDAVTKQVVRVDAPQQLPQIERVVFSRRE
jgi:hypothetical protein